MSSKAVVMPPPQSYDKCFNFYFSINININYKGLFLCSAYLNTCSVHHKCVTWAGRCGGNTTKHFLTANIFVKSVQVEPPVWWEMLMPGLLFPICFGKKVATKMTLILFLFTKLTSMIVSVALP